MIDRLIFWQTRIELAEGPCILQFPQELSTESLTVLEETMALQLRTLRRLAEARAAMNASPEKPDER